MDDAILAALARNTAHLVVVTDAQGAVVWVNAAFEQTTGYRLDEIRGRRPSDFLHGPGTDPAALRELHDAVAANRPFSGLQLANYTRDGREYWIELELRPLFDAQGRVTHRIALQQDITAWKQAQDRYTRNEKLLNDASQIAHVGAWDVDVTTGELRWTDETYAIHELPVGAPVTVEMSLGMFTPGSRERIEAAVQRAIREGEPYDVELEIVTALGKRRWTRAIGNAQWRDGRVVRIAGTFQDITEQRAVQERLSDLADRLDLAAEVAGLGVWEVVLAENRLKWNERMYHLFGLPHDAELTLEHWVQCVHPEDRERARQLARGLMRGEITSIDAEFRVVHPDGEVREIRSVGRRMVSHDQALLVGTTIDITEQKRAAQAQMEKEAAQRASLAKSEFLSRVSHELRTPLNGVLGFAQLLERDAHNLPPTQREHVRRLRTASNHLLQIVNDMLDLASIESGAIRLSIESVSLAELVHETLTLVQPIAMAQGIHLECSAPDGEPVCAQADRTRLRQVIINLLSNAIKYNREHGSVLVSWERRGEQACLAVRDSGAGLDARRQAQLFQPFNRLGAESSTIEGTGLGLSISRRLMLAMGGSVDVESEPGVGTVFTLRLPLAAVPCPVVAPPREATEERPRPAAPGGQVRVLYVEDNPLNVLLMQHALALFDNRYRLDVAASGEQAMALFDGATPDFLPDLVLLDLNLPGITGYQVLHRLRSVAGARHLPCVAVSADAMPEELARARREGFDDYWTKPLDLMSLDDRIRQVLRRAPASP